jgi:uncharacterized membrane protein
MGLVTRDTFPGSPKPPSRPRDAGFYQRRIALALAALIVLAAAALMQKPRFGLILSESPVVQGHLYFALGAFALGAVQLAARKGGLAHRIIGWVWVMMIGAAVVASGFVMKDNPGSWSWIHTTTLVHGTTLALAVYFAVQRNIRWHARMMTFTYVSGLIGGTLIAFIPDRLMWQMFFGHM